uniref:Uncharacterized protein n=1 Tax=Cyprinus carpio TaxID=7962 RepID=A0A8C2L785_CYPCA
MRENVIWLLVPHCPSKSHLLSCNRCIAKWSPYLSASLINFSDCIRLVDLHVAFCLFMCLILSNSTFTFGFISCSHKPMSCLKDRMFYHIVSPIT